MTATRITSSSGGTSGLGGYYDVTSAPYGAVGNGTTDDTAAVQAAMNAAFAVKGTVYFPPGTYKITSTLQIHGHYGFRMTGAGDAHNATYSAELLYTAATGPLLEFQDSGGFELDHLSLVWNNAAYAGNVVTIGWGALSSDPQRWEIHHCVFNGASALVGESCVKLDHAIIGSIHHNHINGCQSGIKVSSSGYCVGVDIFDNTYNNHRDAHIWLSSGDIEVLHVHDETFEINPANGAVYGDATCGLYGFQMDNCWFGDDASSNTWVNGLKTTGNNFVGMIGPGNRFAGSGSSLSLVGRWIVMGNTFETGTAYATVASLSLTDIGNFYNMTGANVFAGGHPPTGGYVAFGSAAISGGGTDSHVGNGLHVGHSGGAAGFNATELADTNAQIAIGSNGANGAGVLASSNRALIYTDFNTAYNGPGILRLQAPAVQSANEVQLIAGTTAPAPLVRASGAGLGFYNVAPVAQASRAGQLTDSTGGTVSGTLAAGITDTVAKNAIASLAAKVNAIETIIHNLGLSA